MVYVKCLNGGVAAHIVLTELDDQKLLSRDMASIKGRFHIFLTLFYFFKSIMKAFQNLLSQNEAVN